MPSIQIKPVSSLEKCFWDDRLENIPETRDFQMFANECLSFQFAIYNEVMERPTRNAEIRIEGPLAPYAETRLVVSIPSMFPVNPDDCDEDYLSHNTPGLYPDLLRPLHYRHSVRLAPQQITSVWVSLRLPEGFDPGVYDLTLSVYMLMSSKDKESTLLGDSSVTVRVLDAKLPPQKLIHTEWFYTDCIANAYHTEVFSEQHWRAIESFLRVAVDNGINMILTPIFTPELDTYIGGERRTTQLIDVTVEKDGSYSFGFDKLDRWLELCQKVGVEYYEIPHFFTQWGALHAPKILAMVNGVEKQIFGWDTDSVGEQYAAFLGALIPAFVAHMKQRGLDQKCFYHVSDEPKLEQLEHYKKCRELIGQYLGDYPVIDALSHYEFYEQGVLKKPVAFTGHVEGFLEKKVPGLWAYYCGAGGGRLISNRFFATSLARARILGVQLWLHRIEGFLHWGYNFYNNCRSYDALDPFHCSDGEFFVPSGDTYLVYPGDGETAWESIRLNAMREAVDDMRALDLCESIHGRAFTERLVLEDTDGTLTFTHYPKDADYLLNLRRKIASAVDGK